MSGDLKFDSMAVDVSQSLKYFKHSRNFHSIGYEDNGKSVHDVRNNIIFYADYGRPSFTFNIEEHRNKLSKEYFETLPTKLNNLAQNINEKKMLFAQIDYMLRKTEIEETVDFDLRLILQNLQYVSSSPQRKCYKSNVIVMHEKSPLATLGFVAQMLCAHNEVVIESTSETAVLCHLFTNMCHKAKLDNVRLAFVEYALPGANDVTEVKELQSCCMGVVTERSDIDSAVDVLLASTAKYPWKIRRILVQECVGERLKRTLAWRAKLNPANCNLDEVKTHCSNVYNIGDKIYLCEYTGDEVMENYVIIEAYRTVRELLSLLNTYKPFSVSLWCSDASESNEIAYGIDSSVVWINDYGSFDGPSKSSQALYSIIDASFSRIGITPATDFENLLAVRDKWNKLSGDEKRELFNVVLKKTQKSTILFNHVAFESEEENGNFVHVGNGRICVGLELPVGAVVFHHPGYPIEDALSSILKGNAVSYRWSDLNNGLYGPMRQEGVPLVSFHNENEGDHQVASQYSMYKVKVIRTNFGTIFAN